MLVLEVSDVLASYQIFEFKAREGYDQDHIHEMNCINDIPIKQM